MPFSVARLADQDLLDILRFGGERFGPPAAIGYYDGLIEAFELLAQFPGMGRGIGNGQRMRAYKAHVIIYRIEGEYAVTILRVVHGASDWRKHLHDSR